MNEIQDQRNGPGFLPPDDAFGRTAPLVYEVVLPVLGLPVRIRSNAERAIQHAEAAFGAWKSLPGALVVPSVAACFDVIVQPATEEALPAFAYRRHGPVFMAASSVAMASVLLDAGHAVAFVPAQGLDDAEWFQANVLGLVWMLASRKRRVPLHAAVVLGEARVLLLLADSGTGKSTLTYACVRAGLRALTEDTVFVDLDDRRGGVRLWGALPCHWLPTDTVAVFPEVAAWPMVMRANRKRRIRVPAVGAPVLVTTAPVTAVLLMAEGDTPVIESMPGDALADVVAADRTEGFDQYPDSRPAVEAWLRTRPAYRCLRGRDPRATATLLASLASSRESSATFTPSFGAINQ